MKIRVKGAKENNLKNIDVEIGDGLTVVTGVSGSGKTSLIFDTIHHEAQRRFQEAFTFGSPTQRRPPANVDQITGLGPTIAVAQNQLNRNPNSTLATASGLHPFLRILYTHHGTRTCPNCNTPLKTQTTDELIENIQKQPKPTPIHAPLLKNATGSHKTLLKYLTEQFGTQNIQTDNKPWNQKPLDPTTPHTIKIKLGEITPKTTRIETRDIIEDAQALGASYIDVGDPPQSLSYTQTCTNCGRWFNQLRPTHFHRQCPHCKGQGCNHCNNTGLHPEASTVTWTKRTLPELLTLTAQQAHDLFQENPLPETGQRLNTEITRRLESLLTVGLGYLNLDRSSPTLSRGESQRVRLAVALTSQMEDILHILDEPTIGQHPHDVQRLLPAFRQLAGPVLYVEHDRVAAAQANQAIDLGLGAGAEGGEIIFNGTTEDLWKANTPTGRYFSLREKVAAPQRRKTPIRFITIKGAYKHNLKDIEVKIPLARLTVITGVSGSGKSTLVEKVLVPTLKNKEPTGCTQYIGEWVNPIMVDQSPIGKNPRSTPATYTKLSDIIRDLYSQKTGLSASHFSFNRPEGACPTCNGMGAVEIKMRYLPSTWIRCRDCEGKRYNEKVLEASISFGDRKLTISDFYNLSIREAAQVLKQTSMNQKDRQAANKIIDALTDIGLGYLTLGQPSPTLSGGEAQRVKLAKYLGRRNHRDRVIILDEPSTGLHPQDLAGLLTVLDRLVKTGATVIVVEHNTDIIRAADWVIDLGPGAGPKGGQVIYTGDPDGLEKSENSLTGQALREEALLEPGYIDEGYVKSDYISIRGARANNLKNVNVDFPKGKLTVVTGVSGSGKSSLVTDILETEARKRYLETLSLYERQGTKEGPEAPVDSVTGLGVSVTITPDRKLYSRRSTVGTATEISHHLSVLYSTIGERTCHTCGAKMTRDTQWICPNCQATLPVAPARYFMTNNYSSACTTCHGVGTLQKPNPSKLIKYPDLPLCKGAMHSPGFFPQGYLCKPGNNGHDIVQTFAARHGFDTFNTPWNQVPENIQKMFYYGDPEPMEVTFTNPKGIQRTRTITYPGFYGWIRDWDIGGTYSDTITCPDCQGARLRPRYLNVTIQDHNIHQLWETSLKQLNNIINNITLPPTHPAYHNHQTIKKRLTFLIKVGLGYIHLNRITATLSAGEAQRIKLAGLLGSGITSLTILLDEPTRGLHPSEVDALVEALIQLRDEGNTVIIVEHDLGVITKADHIIDMGPGPGKTGGQVMATGTPQELTTKDTITGKWLKKTRTPREYTRRKPKKWMTIKGAKENNLKEDTVEIPLGVLVGISGVSGSGKSTLLIDTIGRALSPIKHTTSVAREPLEPGKHDSITGAPNKTIIIDQTKKGIQSPAKYLDLTKHLQKIYSESEDAQALEITEKTLKRGCTACHGTGTIRTDMEFLPTIYTTCETCQGTGYTPEAWDIKIRDISLPEANHLTIDEAHNHFKDYPKITTPLQAAKEVGLGYLVLNQPGYSLSGGEAQRLKIAKELCKRNNKDTLYILDEPTLGQHMEDLQRLKQVLQRLVAEGHSVIIIEHHPDILAECDYLIELGPGGGPEGGKIISKGTLEQVAQTAAATAPYLMEILEEQL